MPAVCTDFLYGGTHVSPAPEEEPVIAPGASQRW